MQDDPFYGKQACPKGLMDMRLTISKVIMDATKDLPKDKFIYKVHDFINPARAGIGFAFRQYVTEKYFNLGNKWQEIVNIYYAGHWAIGFAKNKIIVMQ
jgi:hypothetical protein